MSDTWDEDLPGLTDEQLMERLALARYYERSSTAKGAGRYPKARTDWRLRRDAAGAEVVRRTPIE